MNLPLSLALYFLIWWTLLFAILPFGVRTQGEAGEVVPGTPASAPVKPRFWWIIGVNTLVSAVVFAIVRAAVVYQWMPIDLIGMARPTGVQ